MVADIKNKSIEETKHTMLTQALGLFHPYFYLYDLNDFDIEYDKDEGFFNLKHKKTGEYAKKDFIRGT